jgi:hypothetical protein
MQGGRIKAPTHSYVVRRLFDTTEYLCDFKRKEWRQKKHPRYARPNERAARMAAILRRQPKVIEYPIFIVGRE